MIILSQPRKAKYTCNCCQEETSSARPISVTNVEGLTLCNSCHVKLHHRKELRLTDEYVLRFSGEKRGDFPLLKVYHDLTDEKFWENRERAYLHAEMDNQCLVGWDVHESY